MTNWDKIKDVMGELIKDATAEKFSRILMDGMTPCRCCAIEDECNRIYFKTDKNGNLLRAENGDLIYKKESISLECSDIILDWLNRERNEENAGN